MTVTKWKLVECSCGEHAEYKTYRALHRWMNLHYEMGHTLGPIEFGVAT